MYGIHTSYGATFIGVACLMTVLSIGAVIIRFWSRMIKRVSYSLDDWLILGGLIFYLGEMAAHFIGPIEGGVGQHYWNTSYAEIELSYHALTMIEWIYAISFTLVRCSICVFFYRVFILKWFRRSMLAVIGLSIAWMLFVLIYIFAGCTPFAYHWDLAIPGGHCWPQYPYWYAVAGGGIVCNLFIWILPQFVIWNLKMNRIQKIGIGAMFALGVLDIAVESVRLVMFYRLSTTKDVTWGMAGVEIWSFSEIGVCIILACLPLSRPAVSKIFGLKDPSSNYVVHGSDSSRESKLKGTTRSSSVEEGKYHFSRSDGDAYCHLDPIIVERVENAESSLGQSSTSSDVELREGITVRKDITICEHRELKPGDIV